MLQAIVTTILTTIVSVKDFKTFSKKKGLCTSTFFFMCEPCEYENRERLVGIVLCLICEDIVFMLTILAPN